LGILLTVQKFQAQFLRLITLTWLLPPMVGFSFLLYLEVFTFEQVLSMMSTPLKPVFLISGLLIALIYFKNFSKSLSAYLITPDKYHKATTEQALRRFPLHYWSAFIGYISLAPATAIMSLEITTNYHAMPVDWFRVHLVALIVSITVGLPIFISIYDLFGKAFGKMNLLQPIFTIKTKVFLIGALIPLLIDTMLVQYYWTRTGFFSLETFFIWLLLELIAIAGALLFVNSFNQSLTPLKNLISNQANSTGIKIQAISTDELGIFSNQLGKLLDEQQLTQERLSFSNDLLKASHSHESLARLLETIVNRTCKSLGGDICFLSLYDEKKRKLICVAHSQGGYKAEGHFQIALDETSLHADVFKSSKPISIENVPNSLRSHIKLKKEFNILSAAAVPLYSNDETIGVLQIASTKYTHDFTEHEIKTLQAFAKEAAIIQLFFEDLKKRRKAETAITQIMQAVSTATGTDFFKAITLQMANILQADSCGVASTISDNLETVETLAFFLDGKINDNFKYRLKGTPCQSIIGNKACSYTSNIQKLFPNDIYLIENKMESYVGTPLFNSQKKPLGLLFATFRNKIENIEFNESILHIFAARTAAEIERTQNEEHIKHMAYYDGLTQLPNREFLLDRLQNAIEHAKQNNTKLAVMMMDLDNFKKINDSLGHPIGDGLLKDVATRLQKHIRKEDTVARLGGDEFVILQSGFETRESTITHINRIAKQLHATLKEHYYIAEHTLMISTSCGIAIFPDDGDSAELLIKHADTALYKAKESGRDNYRFFSNEMNIAAIERLEMESAIHTGIKEQQFEVAYQPKVSIQDNRIIGAEILLRWNHPVLGYISPERFIPIADETGQIIELGEFVFEQACIETSKLWCKPGFCKEIYSLSVNVSPRQFQHHGFIEKIKSIMNTHNTNPLCIELEVTENILIEDTNKVSDRLQTLKDLGLKISIDDFGTGYASFRYLQQLPIDMIKIDRSFISHICSNTSDLAIVKTIMTMAENLDIKIIAEGVETAEQLDLLSQLGCKYYQGYYYSKPINAEKFNEMIALQREKLILSTS